MSLAGAELEPQPQSRLEITVPVVKIEIEKYNSRVLPGISRDLYPYSMANPNCVGKLAKRFFDLEAPPSERAIRMAFRNIGLSGGHYWSTPFETCKILRKIDLSHIEPAGDSRTKDNGSSKVRTNNGFIPDPKLLNLEGPSIARAEAAKRLGLGPRGLGQLCHDVFGFPPGDLPPGEVAQVEEYLDWQRQQVPIAAMASTRTEQIRLLGIGRDTARKACEKLHISDFRSRLLIEKELLAVVASIRQN